MDRNTQLLLDYKNGDLSARDKLCEENMPLVHKAVSHFAGKSAESEDLFQTGAIGLIKAIDNFDLSFGVKFSTYAVPMILGEIRRFLRDDGIIKVSRSLKQSAGRGCRARDRLYVNLGREPTIEEISRECGISTEELIEAFEATAPPDSVNRELFDNSDEVMENRLTTEDYEEKIVRRLFVDGLLSHLEERERQILVLHYFKGKTQQEIAPIIGVSQVQISRIEKRALEKIRQTEKR